MIAPTVFPVGVSTNWLKILSTIAHIFLNFTANRTNFVEMYSLGSATCAPNFVDIGAQEHSFHTLLLFGAKKKNTTSFRDSYLRNCWGYFFQIWYAKYSI